MLPAEAIARHAHQHFRLAVGIDGPILHGPPAEMHMRVEGEQLDIVKQGFPALHPIRRSAGWNHETRVADPEVENAFGRRSFREDEADPASIARRLSIRRVVNLQANIAPRPN